ncbi:glyoxalase/bleomycin resistance/extradiol dioxygenase family protein [Aquimarina sp. D1M17]|uniref:glyoxalase/bleomycin resistance/extradiol dioxygenase family protein n=1 Tax=Aquimarina acroporae TaxID=2937283 RepID=UPI0020BD8367|nr:glyoxalase/bleomycin resistance/extradiol dioxygenase family protein [Aquimarina acroporae]MCK8522850.1 glyoxalase/bleomycin resistance/extradiol dioxygenase family protein [Aquimarina acroporae]
MKPAVIIPVLPSLDIKRDIAWYEEKTGFTFLFGDHMYAGIRKDNLTIHLQWHADTEDDPLLGGSVIKIFVEDIQPIFEDFVNRGTVPKDKLRRHTPWNTHEFGFYDLNNNAIFFVQDVV